MIDSMDNAVTVNGSLLSPIGSDTSKSYLNDSSSLRDMRETYFKDSDLSNYGPTGSSNNFKPSLEKLHSKGNDSFNVVNDLVDTNGSKCKSSMRSSKVNNGESNTIHSDFEWVGNKSQLWSNRSKHDYEASPGVSTNGRASKVNSSKEQNIICGHQDSSGMYVHVIGDT